MKRIIAFFMCMQFAWAGERQEEDTLAPMLSRTFGLNVTAENGSYFIQGAPQAVKIFCDTMQDPMCLRQTFSLVSANESSVKIQSQPPLTFRDFLFAVGVEEEMLDALRWETFTNQEGKICIPKKRFGIFDAYLTALADEKQGPLLHWGLKNLQEVMKEEADGYVFNYALFNEFISSDLHALVTPVETMMEEAKVEAVTSIAEEVQLTVPVDKLLKLFITAIGDHLMLQPNGNGCYTLKVISLGEESKDGRANEKVKVVLAVDTSSSMAGAPINAVNNAMPELLRGMHNALPNGTLDLVSFDTVLTSKIHDKALAEINSVDPMSATGKSTNLLHILNKLYLDLGETYRIVIAFTDGAHNAKGVNLDVELDKLENHVRIGKNIAQTFLCKVGDKTTEQYFIKMNTICGGSYFQSSSVPDFLAVLFQKLESILEQKNTFLLSLEGKPVTVRIPQARSGLYAISDNIHPGDTIRQEGGEEKLLGDSVVSAADIGMNISTMSPRDLRDALVNQVVALSDEQVREVVNEASKNGSWFRKMFRRSESEGSNCTIS